MPRRFTGHSPITNPQISTEALFPVVVAADRFHGTYSGGLWFAIAFADRPYHDTGRMEPTRIGFCLDEGPNGDDDEARVFWHRKPSWIAVGDTPEAAIRALCATYGDD